jgi:hypothetical protein
VPKEFSPSLKELKGWIIEDVWVDKYDTWEPHIQAIKHENGDLSLRMCVYLKESKEAKPTWSPYSFCFYDWTIEDLREEIKKHKADVIRMLLRKYLE